MAGIRQLALSAGGAKAAGAALSAAKRQAGGMGAGQAGIAFYSAAQHLPLSACCVCSCRHRRVIFIIYLPEKVKSGGISTTRRLFADGSRSTTSSV